jgi:hypothetical protein
VKRKNILAAVVGLVSLISLLGCGDPAIGTLQTIKLTAVVAQNGGLVEVQGVGGTLQLGALGVYTKSSVNLTQKVTYAVIPVGTDLSGFPLLSPPQTLTVNASGLATAVTPFVCTFHNAGTAQSPAYVLTGSYQVTATYKGVTSNPIFIAVASAAGDGPSGACGP